MVFGQIFLERVTLMYEPMLNYILSVEKANYKFFKSTTFLTIAIVSVSAYIIYKKTKKIDSLKEENRVLKNKISEE